MVTYAKILKVVNPRDIAGEHKKKKKVSGRGEFSLEVNMGSDSVPPKPFRRLEFPSDEREEEEEFPLVPWGFFWAESHPWLEHWHSYGYPTRRLAL